MAGHAEDENEYPLVYNTHFTFNNCTINNITSNVTGGLGDVGGGDGDPDGEPVGGITVPEPIVPPGK